MTNLDAGKRESAFKKLIKDRPKPTSGQGISEGDGIREEPPEEGLVAIFHTPPPEPPPERKLLLTSKQTLMLGGGIVAIIVGHDARYYLLWGQFIQIFRYGLFSCGEYT